MLRWRLLLGTALIATLVGLCWLDLRATVPGTWILLLAAVAALLGAGEVVELLAARGPRASSWVAMFAAPLVVVSVMTPRFWPGYPADCPLGSFGWPALAVALGLLLAVLVEMRRFDQPGDATARIATATFAVVYVGLLLSFAMQLRLLEPSRRGLLALFSMIAVVKLSDIGAYTVGRLIGRHKLAPVLSPGKTWEGAAGGLLFACGGAYLVLGPLARSLGVAAVPSPPPAWGWIVYGAALTAAGLVGDLAESLLKRDAGRKDSSSWMPGFGGVLDLLDSVLAAAPVAYALWAARLVDAF